MLPLFFAAVTTAVSLSAASKQRRAEKQAAAVSEEVGKLEARQYMTEMFLGRAAAIDAGTRRVKEMQLAENQNIARFSAMGRDDRSVDAFLRRNRELAAQDVREIERASEIQAAKKMTEAAVAYEYGQNAAAGIRAQSSANYLTNMANIAQNIPAMLPKTSNVPAPPPSRPTI
jgi:hypothetical protein